MFSAQRRAVQEYLECRFLCEFLSPRGEWLEAPLAHACTCHADVAFLVDVRGAVAERHGTPARSRECDNGHCGVKFLQAPQHSELWHFLFVGEAFHVAARAPVSLVGDDRAWQAKRCHGRARARSGRPTVCKSHEQEQCTQQQVLAPHVFCHFCLSHMNRSWRCKASDVRSLHNSESLVCAELTLSTASGYKEEGPLTRTTITTRLSRRWRNLAPR